MHIVAIGGPAYPIGVGGGAASSMMQGQNTENLDFNSVQRGNAEMENRANRVIRACFEMGDNNPVSSIHDQGAGGPSNVLTELLEPLGGVINIREINLGDKTMSVREIWSAEYQERYGLLIRPDQLVVFQQICERERVNCEVLGSIDGSGKVVIEDSSTGETPVNLDLGQILTNMPQKEFKSDRKKNRGLKPLVIPENLSIGQAVNMVFRLPQVGSKGHLVYKVDRSVTGLVVQQQCCGIAQIPIADNSVNAQSLFGTTGSVSSLGEQPNLMLIDPRAGARMAVAEMLTNMASVKVTGLGDVRCRANWMWPAKLPHEGADLYDAAVAMSDFMIGLGIAIDGGKDSASMAATVQGELVKAPGCLVILGYAPVPDIAKVVTPDIKQPGESYLVLIDLGMGKNRLGGSSFAQALNQLGDESPDVDPQLLKNAFLAVQKMVDEGIVLSVHDRSGGGLITTVAEMCMASGCGFELNVKNERTWHSELFTEELGFVLEVDKTTTYAPVRINEICQEFGVPVAVVGQTSKDGVCKVVGRDYLWRTTTPGIRILWEVTSDQLQKLQKNPECATEESRGHGVQLPDIKIHPAYKLTFEPRVTTSKILKVSNKPRVAILREEGTNGDREMAAAFYMAGFDPVDVAMNDLLNGVWSDLNCFRGVVFPGGFSFMDVFDSAKGWAATILFNERLSQMFNDFYVREDTFSFGVCNGCQLMALLGWIPWKGIASSMQPRFVHNVSGRFESRWAQVEILPSPSIMLAGMEGSRIGVWVAHGEGQLVYPDSAIQKKVKEQKLAPLAYINPLGNQTIEYPYNPNGSPEGITALCTPDGRHLAMMPHPERCFLPWQQPWMPSDWKNLKASPWLRMFQNARTWCDGH
jgi:phosphoribosylformylglycinamidine synthase